MEQPMGMYQQHPPMGGFQSNPNSSQQPQQIGTPPWYQPELKPASQVTSHHQGMPNISNPFSSSSAMSTFSPKARPSFYLGIVVILFVVVVTILVRIFFPIDYNNNGESSIYFFGPSRHAQNRRLAMNEMSDCKRKVIHLLKEAARYNSMATQDTSALYALINSTYALSYINAARLQMSDDEIAMATQIHASEFVMVVTDTQQKAMKQLVQQCPALMEQMSDYNGYAMFSGYVG